MQKKVHQNCKKTTVQEHLGTSQLQQLKLETEAKWDWQNQNLSLTCPRI